MKIPAPMVRAAACLALALYPFAQCHAQPAKLPSVARGLVNPESVAFDAQGRLLVTAIGEFDKDGDGQVIAFSGADKKVIAEGLNDPKGITVWEQIVFVTDKNRVMRIDAKGNVEVWADAAAFPKPPKFLNDIVTDTVGNVYVSDSGDLKGNDGAVYRIATDRTITTVLDSSNPAVKTPNGLIFNGADLLVLDFGSGVLSRLNLANKSLTPVADGFPGGDGLAWDWDGNLYVSQWTTGRVSVLRGGKGPAETVSTAFEQAADIASHPRFGQVFVPDMKAGTVTPVSWVNNNPKVDESPLAVKIEPAFTNAQVDRPIVVTHAGDGSNRIFIVSQKGKVYALAGDQANADPKLFFDLTKQIKYADNQNEEGFLGFAFHPKFKENGQFFAYYTTTAKPLTSIISRFRVSKESPTKAEVASEEQLLEIPQPYWNHNGGTIAFGPDGCLYVGLGDGGAGNDPHGHAQNLGTLLGSILRIDVDHQDPGLKYAVPKDNPFVAKAGARPEIWAYGVRNIWRLSFDRQTGSLWAADVGQDIWEEINVVSKGGNYGWNLREARHKFRPNGSPPRADLIEPIWEYHHDIGKSVTGGHVYRGKRVPELAGLYVYADYVTGRIWGLQYDDAQRQVVANRPIAGNSQPVMSFGEDEQGELYFTTPSGQMFRFASGK